MKLLLKKGANVEQKDRWGGTPLRELTPFEQEAHVHMQTGLSRVHPVRLYQATRSARGILTAPRNCA